MNNQFGKLSKLHIRTACREGKTILEDVSFTAPFKIMHPFYEKKDFMTVMLLTASAGIMAGDRQEIDVCVKENSNMEFVSQAYEKIHQMEGDCAKRHVHLTVGDNACLHYMPLPAIPFAGSDYRCTVNVELENETSQFVFSEILSCGRIAHGEEFQYRRFQNRICIYQGGRIVYRDYACYEPERMDMRNFGMYEGFTHLANMVICNKQKPEDWVRQGRELLENSKNMQGGVTRTSAGHIALRILGRNAHKLTEITEKILTL
mgnify:FL=1